MSPYSALKAIGKIQPGTMLDVGARDCTIARNFAKLGYKVHAIDPKPVVPLILAENVTFEKNTLENYQVCTPYDLVVASGVSHLVRYSMEDFLLKLGSLIKPKGLIYVTFLGKDDEWQEQPWSKTTDFEAIQEFTEQHQMQTLYRSTEWFQGKMINGTPKYWNWLAFVLQKN